jgi:drug/metabolite transporter (DMT)-like permease
MRGVAVQRLILACALWGLSFPAVKALTLVQQSACAGYDSWLYSTAALVARFALAALLLAVGLWWVRGRLRVQRLEVEQGLLVALSSGLGMLFQVDGLAHTEASTSAFLTQGSIIFVPLVRWVLWRKRVTWSELLRVGIAVIGVAILSGFSLEGWTLGRGEFETLIAAMFFTAHIIFVSAERYAGNDGLNMSLVMFSGIALIFACLLPTLGGGVAAAIESLSDPRAWLFMVILIGPCTLLAFLWMNRWQRYVSAGTAALIYCFEPVFASLLALFLPAWFSDWSGVSYANELMTSRLMLGGTLILLANLDLWPRDAKT